MTPLLLAASTGQEDLVEVLVKAGADAGKHNKDGIGILDLVAAVEQKPMLKFLRKKGKTKQGHSLTMTSAKKPAKDRRHVKHLNFSKLIRQMGIYYVTYPRDLGFQPRPHLGFQPIPLSFWPFRLHEILHDILTFLKPPPQRRATFRAKQRSRVDRRGNEEVAPSQSRRQQEGRWRLTNQTVRKRRLGSGGSEGRGC